MKLEFLFAPTSDLKASLALYRDGLGFTEVWREGDATVALSLPGTDVQLMLDAHDPDAPVGPLFVVDSVEAFHSGRPETLAVVDEPSEIPGGFLAPTGTPAGRPSTSWTSRPTRTLRKTYASARRTQARRRSRRFGSHGDQEP